MRVSSSFFRIAVGLSSMGFWPKRTLAAMRIAPSIALLWILFAAVHLIAQADAPPKLKSLEDEFQSAMAARDQGDLAHAKAILLNLHRRSPSNFAINESLGLIYVSQEKYADALSLLQAAVREQPSSDAAHANLGADYFKLQRNKEALEEYTVAAHLNPRNAATQQGLGELLLDGGKPEQAAEAFSAALASNPNDPDIELSLATALVAERSFDRAQAVLEKTPDADASADVQVLLGQVAEAKGKALDAAHHFQRAVDLEPTEEHVWMLGVEFLRHWTFDAAVPEFEAATEKFPASTRMKIALGASYFGDAKYDQAVPVFASLLDSDKDNALYAELLGMACNAVTESAKAQCSSLLTYAQSHPTDAKASTYAASMLLTETAIEHKTDQARMLLMRAIAAAPHFADAQYQMGLLKQEDGDWHGSVPNLELAVKLKPGLAQAHYRLALAYWRTGRKDEAQAQMAMQKQYSQQERQDLDQRLRQITTFLVDVKKR
jgi:tetratricopeptide (TPR) repeat protein